MDIQSTISTSIYIHAGLGAIALLSGAIALIAKKGNRVHKGAGKVFYYSMLTSALMSMVISCLPNHENYFLFSIGAFSSYFLLSGYRSLRYKDSEYKFSFDKVLSYFIILTGICMLIGPLIITGELIVVLMVFGALGLFFGIKDLLLFKDKDRARNRWLNLHIGKMLGGYIAAFTAFMVVNNVLPGVWNWFAPAVVGSVYSTYWSRKVTAFSKQKS
jgi:uncharacterized membrane protein